jgi:glycosyltransferase involved in cell wall biosynthesis
MSESVAVLIITRNRASPLRRCLASLSCQTTRPDKIVVVDNGSSDDTAAVIASFESSLPIKCAHERTPSIPRCRNVALRNAATDLAIFLDDDCVADPAWIGEALQAAATNAKASAIQGRIEPSATRLVGKAIAFNDSAYVRRYYPSGQEPGSLRYMATANLLFRMKALAGMSQWFDESLPRSSDREFAARLRLAHHTIAFCPRMVVTHDYDNRSFLSACATFFHRAKGRVAAPEGPLKVGGDARAFPALFWDLARRIFADRSSGIGAKAGMLLLNGCFYSSSALGICYWSASRLFSRRRPRAG